MFPLSPLWPPDSAAQTPCVAAELSSLVKGIRLRHKEPVISRFLTWSGLLLFLTSSLSAAPIHMDSLKVGSKTYSNVTVIGSNTTDLYFTHAQGIANVKLRLLDSALQKRFHYDPQIAAKAEKQQADDDSAYLAILASNIVAKAQQAVNASKKAARTSDDNLADPLTEQSLLGKPAPALQVEKWLGPAPVLKGKVALVTVWAPWSIACRKAIPELNALQKKFGEKLVVVGVSADPQEDVEQMSDPPIEFASGIDTKGRLIRAAGANEIPFTLLIDGKGIVRYQGHPAALDEKKLERFLAKLVD